AHHVTSPSYRPPSAPPLSIRIDIVVPTEEAGSPWPPAPAHCRPQHLLVPAAAPSASAPSPSPDCWGWPGAAPTPRAEGRTTSGARAPPAPHWSSTEGITRAVAELGMYEDTLYGIAPTVNTIALFYDAAALEEAGIAPPTTWDELREAAAALTTPERYGLAFSAIASYEGTWQFLPFMWSDGGDETDLDGEGVIDASRFWADLVREGLVSRSVVNWGQGDVIDQFKAGNVAMVVNGPWNIAGLEEDTPDLDWDVVTIPVPEAGTDPVAPLGGEVWTVPITGD